MRFIGKKGDIEFDELGKMILAAIVLLVIVAIILGAITGELGNQAEKIKDIFKFF